MMSIVRPRFGLLAVVQALILLSAGAALAAPETLSPEAQGLRLIQTSPNHRAWMSQAEIRELQEAQHAKGKCGGFKDVTDYPNVAPSYVMPFVFGGQAEPVPSHGAIINPLLPELSAQEIHGTVEKLSSYPTRFFSDQTGNDSALWIRDRFVQLARGRSDVQTELFTHKWKQPSVIVRIPGKGPHADERVIIGAHQDSISFGNKAPGADDDASGIATLLEIFRVLAQSGYQPDRTLEFMAYAAEEVGLRGSQDIAQKYKAQGVKVAGVMQFDMTMYPGASHKLTFITDHVDPSATQFGRQLVDTYVKVEQADSECGYACSDHASWTDAGYSSVFPFEAPFDEYNQNIHTPRDTLDILDAAFGLSFAKLGLAWLVEMSAAAQ